MKKLHMIATVGALLLATTGATFASWTDNDVQYDRYHHSQVGQW